jgi:hypothetical protein
LFREVYSGLDPRESIPTCPMPKVEELMQEWDWAPIANCPGRYIMRGSPVLLTPQDLAGGRIEVGSFDVPEATDTVTVVVLDDGGLISYKRSDGSYVHTLNTREGFERKLASLGIRPR